jgi:nicotinamide phosphoribosyltransferase
MTCNWLFDTDSYKASHHEQYPPGSTFMFSYFESRGGKFPKTVFFGMQYLLKKYLTVRIGAGAVETAAAFFAKHGEPFNRDGFMHIVKDHYGALPVRIRAVPEGSVVPAHNVLFTVESTCAKCFWIVSYVETMLVRLWYPTTVATLSHRCKSIISDWLKKTADDESGLPFKLHDFGSRGVSSQESAAIGGAAHLLNFMGSDTVVGALMAEEFYGTEAGIAAYSIPAAEHSTITAWGREREVEAYRNMLRLFAKPGSIVAVVSDSYDLQNAVENLWGVELKQAVIDSGATVVIRPDSGVPWEVVVDTLQRLDTFFGSKTNMRGYRVLNHVRVIQGDGINDESIGRILYDAAQAGYSADNIAFGMGGGLLQQCNRDTNKFAFKCSAIQIDGEVRPVFKAPKGDEDKRSKRGLVDLVGNSPYDGGYQTVAYDREEGPSRHSALVTVFEDGEIRQTWTFDECRARTWRPE